MPPRTVRAAAFACGAGFVLLHALQGGAYDIVVRQEIGLAVWWLLTIGFATLLLPRGRPAPAAAGLVLAMFGLTVWTALSFGWTESDERTWIEVARLAHHLGVVTLAVAALDARTWAFAAAGLAAAAAFVCLLAVISRLAPDLLTSELVRSGTEERRLSYPLEYWNALAAWGAMSGGMMLAWSAHGERVATRSLALATLPIIVVCVYLTYSRAGAGGAVLGPVVAVLVARNRWTTMAHLVGAALACLPAVLVLRGRDQLLDGTGTGGSGAVALALVVSALLAAAVPLATRFAGADRLWRLPRRAARSATAGAVVAAVIAAVAVGPALADEAWDSFRSEERVDLSQGVSFGGNRHNIYDSTIAAFEEKPGQGFGAGTFEFWWNREARDLEYIRDGHSLYLETAAELGVPGILLLLALVVFGAWAILRARLRAETGTQLGAATGIAAAAGVWALHAGIDWIWETTAVTVLALAGVGAAAASLGRPTRGGLAVAAPMVIIALVAIAVQLPPAVSTSEVRESQQSVRVGDLDGAIAAANAAREAQPWSASAMLQQALVLERRGELRSAVAAARDAAEAEPTNWRHPLVVARLEAALGNVDEALAAFRKAKRLRPLSRIFAPG